MMEHLADDPKKGVTCAEFKAFMRGVMTDQTLEAADLNASTVAARIRATAT